MKPACKTKSAVYTWYKKLKAMCLPLTFNEGLHKKQKMTAKLWMKQGEMGSEIGSVAN